MKSKLPGESSREELAHREENKNLRISKASIQRSRDKVLWIQCTGDTDDKGLNNELNKISGSRKVNGAVQYTLHLIQRNMSIFQGQEF